MNIYQFFIPVFNLIIDENVEERSLYGRNFALSKFSENTIQAAGVIYTQNILTWPIFYFEETEISSNINIQMHEVNSFHSSILGTGFWLVKDCGCYAPFAILYDPKTTGIWSDNRNVFFSSSKGSYAKVNFSKSEILLAFDLYEKIGQVVNQEKKIAEAEIEEKTIKGSLTRLEYNDLNSIERCLNFISFARTSSFIPYKISMYIVALESLFGLGETGDLTFKLSLRIPIFLTKDLEDRKNYSLLIKKAYKIRSSFLHGDRFDKATSKIDQGEISFKLDAILRETILRIINDQKVKENFLNKELFSSLLMDDLFK